MDDLSSVSWLWRGLRGRSVTFAALFAVSVLGLSVVASLRRVIAWTHAPLLTWLLLPAFVIGVLAKKELEWIPDPQQRAKWARGLILGSILAAVLSSWLLPEPPPLAGEPVRERPVRRGPPSR